MEVNRFLFVCKALLRRTCWPTLLGSAALAVHSGGVVLRAAPASCGRSVAQQAAAEALLLHRCAIAVGA